MQRLDVAVLLGASLCALVAAWFSAVILLVLRARSPDSARAWAIVAVGLGQGLLVPSSLVAGQRPRAGG